MVTIVFLLKMRRLKDVLGIKREIYYKFVVVAVYVSLVFALDGTCLEVLRWWI